MDSSIVFLPNWIGDMILALSVVMRLPESRRSTFTLLVPKNMSSLAGLLCDLPQIVYNRQNENERNQTLATVRAGNFKTIYLCPFSFSSAWFAMQTRIPRRRGVSREFRRLLLTDRLPYRFRDKSCHITAEYADLLETRFIAPEEWRGICITPDAGYAGSLVFCPGAAYGPTKRWPYFPDMVNLLHNDHIVILGTNDDREYAREIAGRASARVTDLTGKTSLTEAAAIMAGARAVVSNDSGLMHLAGYLGVPTIGLYGSTDPVWTRPLGSRSVTLKSLEPCSPCFDRTCKLKHYRCLETITTSDVLEAIRRI